MFCFLECCILTLEPLLFKNTYIVNGFKANDERGWFAKNFQQDEYSRLGLNFTCKETFFSWSKCGVLRGMHFQMPPHAQNKIVTCLSGTVLDVLLDLRKSSPHYGKSVCVELNGEASRSIFVPLGVAHGFIVLSDEALLGYQTSTAHNSNSDTGIQWNSFGFDWPSDSPIVSKRDANLPLFSEFSSPF